MEALEGNGIWRPAVTLACLIGLLWLLYLSGDQGYWCLVLSLLINAIINSSVVGRVVTMLAYQVGGFVTKGV